jgi:hypothetical protein
MARDTWLRRAGQDAPSPWPAATDQGMACGRDTCWIDRPGHSVALVLAPRGLAEACAHATLLVTPLTLWRDCPAPLLVVERGAIIVERGLEIFLRPDGSVRILGVTTTRGRRPWAAAGRAGAEGADQ